MGRVLLLQYFFFSNRHGFIFNSSEVQSCDSVVPSIAPLLVHTRAEIPGGFHLCMHEQSSMKEIAR